MLIAKALLPSSHLRNHVERGVGALPRAHAALIAQGQRRRVGDSLDLDSATRAELPEENRWDYLLSIPDSSCIVAMEPHSARDSEVYTVIAKKRAAAEYLRDHLPARHRVARWFWVASGAVGFSRMDKATRLLDQNGIAFVGRTLRSFD